MATWAGPPRSYTKGRSRAVQYVVIHSTEGSEGVTSAEAGVAYDKIRTDGTSTHIFVDADTALMEVRYSDTAHAARARGNACGIQVELCGRAGQTAAQWHDAASLPMLRLAAREVAAICEEFDLPVRRLSVAEVRAAYYNPPGSRPRGICGHVDVTKAYPEDQGSHTDPGPNFPWSEFLAMVSAEMGSSTEGDAMAQMLIRNKDDGQLYLVDGMFRRKVTADQITAGKITNTGVHLAHLLGNLANNGNVFDTAGDMDVWGALYPPAGLTAAQLDEVEAAAKAGAAEGADGLTEAQVRTIVDKEVVDAIEGTRLTPPA